MSTDQAETAAPTVDEPPPAETNPGPLRAVDDFLADLNVVLDSAADLAVPAPAAEPGPEPDVAATMPDADPDLVVEPQAGTAPAPHPKPATLLSGDWWGTLYRHGDADLDTFTGNVPTPGTAPGPDPVTAPPKPTHVPHVPGSRATVDPVGSKDNTDGKGAATGVAKTARPARKQDRGSAGSGPAPAKASGKGRALVRAAAADASDNRRGRQVVFAATAYGMGWSLGLDDAAKGLMAHAAQLVVPLSGCALCAGLVGLAASVLGNPKLRAIIPTKVGGAVFVGSLALITVLNMVDPPLLVGGCVALGLQVGYRILRRWVGPHGDKWPWKGVLWAVHVPAATATVAFLLYGTN